MTEIKTYCDKCGVVLTSMNDYEEVAIEINHYYKKVDLCASCFEKLTDIVENFFHKESEDTE